MGEEQRIWFVFLTDHHEGPFLVEEIAEKLKSGLITKANLAWKDGMADWQAIEAIAELNSALDAVGSMPNQVPTENPALNAAVNAAVSQDVGQAVAVGGDEGPSLAQQLSASQSAAGPALSLVSSAANAADPDPNESCWSLKNQGSISGPYSFNKLVEMASRGEIKEGFELWRPGLTNFLPGTQYPNISLKSGKTEFSAQKTLQSQTAGAGGLSTLIKKSGVQPAKGAAIASTEEPTDNAIIRPAKASFLDKIKALFTKKKSASAAAPAKKSNVGALVKRFAVYVVLLVLVGGAGAYYWVMIRSPIPELEDVTPDAYEILKEAVRSSESGKLSIAVSQEDLFNPKIYAASNLPEGTLLTLHLDGIAGKLVNSLDFDIKVNSPVAKTKLTTFGPISQDGKPIPMGEYVVTISDSSGKQYFEKQMFLGGPKGPIYERRMKQYQEKLQANYDAEIQELRELVATLKGLREDVERKLSEINAPAAAASRANIWSTFGGSFNLVLQQLEGKIKPKITNTNEVFYPPVYESLLSIITQLKQDYDKEKMAIDANQLSVIGPSVAGLAAQIDAQEQAVAQAVARSPLDALSGKGSKVSGASNATAPGGVPATSVPSNPASSPGTNPAEPPATPSAATPIAPTPAPGQTP